MEALALCREICPECPFIFVTGAVGEERAIETFKSGATDYVLKTRLSRLGMAVRRAVAEAEDVAARKRTVEQLNAAKAAAEHANQAKSQFLANISHELRTPMNAILGMIDVALPRVADAVAEDCLRTAKESAGLLLTLLNDLLDSAKIASGKLDLEVAPFSLRRMLEPDVARVRHARQRERARLSAAAWRRRSPTCFWAIDCACSKCCSTWPETRSSSRKPAAWKSASAVSRRTARPAWSSKCEIRVSASRRTTSNKLFQPFVQGDASMARRYGGSGLGLSICKSLVQLMGGDIRVESTSGGNRFFFTVCLPVGDERRLATDRAPDVASADHAYPLHVLLVEDNLANQKLANYILRDRGHRVDIADNGKEAVRDYRSRFDYDVILMDVQMPIMNGLDATAAIRKRENDGRAPESRAHHRHDGPRDAERPRPMQGGRHGWLSLQAGQARRVSRGSRTIGRHRRPRTFRKGHVHRRGRKQSAH